jgi:hypothetical protein
LHCQAKNYERARKLQIWQVRSRTYLKKMAPDRPPIVDKSTISAAPVYRYTLSLDFPVRLQDEIDQADVPENFKSPL